MSWDFMLIALPLLLFVFLLVLVIVVAFVLKRRTYRGLLLLIATPILIILLIIPISSYYEGFSTNIWVNGIYNEGETFDSFVFDVKNRPEGITGGTYTFTTSLSTDELFQKLDDKFDVFSKDDKMIQVASNNQVFSIKILDKNKYILYGEDLYIKTNSEDFPFPTNKLVEYDPFLAYIPLSKSFEISCDMGYLKRFYGFYKNHVTIDKNSFYFKDMKLTVNGNKAVVELINPPK